MWKNTENLPIHKPNAHTVEPVSSSTHWEIKKHLVPDYTGKFRWKKLMVGVGEL